MWRWWLLGWGRGRASVPKLIQPAELMNHLPVVSGHLLGLALETHGPLEKCKSCLLELVYSWTRMLQYSWVPVREGLHITYSPWEGNRHKIQ